MEVHESMSFKIQGWAPNFIPKIAQDGYDMGLADQIICIDQMKQLCTKELSMKEGIFTGISGGATFASAMKVAEKIDCDYGNALYWQCYRYNGEIFEY